MLNPRFSPRLRECVRALKSPLMTWVKHADILLIPPRRPPPPLPPPRDQHVVKCALNPGIGRVNSPPSPAMPRGSGGRGFN